MSRTKASVLSRIVVLVISIVLLFGAGWIVLNRDYITNQLAVWRYQPSSQMSEIVQRAGLSDTGKFYLYATHPEIQSAAAFNTSCPNQEQAAAILGCYENGRIYIYNVTDKRLDGIQEVTAAHEMLHAVYAQLSPAERRRIDQLVEAEYAKPATHTQLAAKMAIYEKTEPDQLNNELHSIIGTEVTDISGELAEHYNKYFSSRGKTLALHANYQSLFDSLSEQADSLSAEIDVLSKKIDSSRTAYDASAKTLNDDIARFNEKARSGGFTTQAEFANQRADLIARSSSLEADRTTINDDIISYNAKLKQLQSIATETTSLNKSLDSSLSPAPAVN